MMMFLEWEEALLRRKSIEETFLRRKPFTKGNQAKKSLFCPVLPQSGFPCKC